MNKTKDVQFCPKCGSLDISLSKLSNLGDPIKIQGLMGWECNACGYSGKDFFIVTEKDYEKIIKSKKA